MRWLCLYLLFCACTAQVDPVALRARLMPDQIAQLQVPMLFISAPRIKVAATLVKVRQRGPMQIWQTRDGAQITTRNGLVTVTHGLGFDLVGADLAGVTAALAGGPAHYTRRFGYLDSDMSTLVLTYRCRMEIGTSLLHGPGGQHVTSFVEICDGQNSFQNTYHRGADGTLWWSRQWVSVQTGALEVEVIRP